MPRTKPTQLLGTYGHFDLSPENAVETYNESKRLEKFFVKEPYWDVARDNLEFRVIKNREERSELNKRQEAMRLESQLETKENNKLIAEAYEMKEEFRHNVVVFNEMQLLYEKQENELDENMAKELQNQERLKQAIIDKQNEIVELENFSEVLSKTVDSLKPFEDALHQVLPPQNQGTGSNLALLEMLLAWNLAQIEIDDIQPQIVSDVKEMQQNMTQAVNEAALTVMGIINELDLLERRYLTSRAQCLMWERRLVEARDIIADNETTRLCLFEQIKLIYLILCKRRDDPCVYESVEIEKMLDYILSEVQIYQKLDKMVKDRLLENEATIVAQPPSTEKRLTKKQKQYIGKLTKWQEAALAKKQ